MNEITQYLDQLQVDKNTLVENLVAKGVEASNDETFTTLVPKINDIPSGEDIEEYYKLTIDDYRGDMAGISYTMSGWYNAIKKIPPFTLASTNCKYLFYLYPVETIDLSNFDTSNVTDMSYMFSTSKLTPHLDLSHFDTSNVTDMSGMFADTRKLESIDISSFNTSNVTNMQAMFSTSHIRGSIDLSHFDTSNVTNIQGIFYQTGLESISFSGCDFSKVNKAMNMVNLNSSLTNLIFGDDLGKAYTRQSNNYSEYRVSISSTKITHDSLMDVINKLYDLNLTYDVANGGTLYTQSLSIGALNIAKLTAEEIAIATNKGWTVS